DRSKKPKAKDVAEVVARSGSKGGDADPSEDDISRWLLGPEPASAAMNETQNFRIDETRALPSKQPTDTVELAAEPSDADEASDSSKGKKSDKKVVGKLPPLPPKKMSKDSREAAAQILRELGRRR